MCCVRRESARGLDGEVTAPKNPDRAIVASNRLNSVVDAFRRDALRDSDIIRASQRAAELTDADLVYLSSLNAQQLLTHGWTKEQLNVVRHAMQPAARVPFYLRMAHERQTTLMRALPMDTGGDHESAVTIVIPTAVAPSRVEDDDEDDEGET